MSGRTSNLKILLRALSVVAVGALFIAAVAVLASELRQHGLREIFGALGRIQTSQLLGAGAWTLVTFVILAGYDYLGFRYFGAGLRWTRILLASFLAYAFANNFGLANFAGAAVRYRVYSKWKIPAKLVAKVVALDVLSNWLGFLLTTGAVLVWMDPPIPRSLAALPIDSARPLGILFLALLAAYLVAAIPREHPIRLGRWKLSLPDNGIFGLQVLVGCLDFGVSGVVLYVLLPSVPGYGYGQFLGVYLLAKTVAIASHVPGGLGVFETIILFFTRQVFSDTVILSALFAYRAIYYLLPLIVALPIFGFFELTRKRGLTRPAEVRRDSLPGSRSRPS